MRTTPQAQGYTRTVNIDIGDSYFTALIQPDTDLDSTFRAFDLDNQEWLNVNGWLANSIDNAD